jgi:autotransporter-associated beta strand protein
VVDNTIGNGSLTVGNNNQTSAFNGVIQNSAGSLSLTKIGSGTLTLGAANTYTGNTTISDGTLALGSNGSISNTPLISIAARGTLDLSALPNFVLSSNTTLSASGATSPSTLTGGVSIDLGSQPIVLTYDGVHPALSVSQGNLLLNANPVTVNGAALSAGVYTIIQQASGAVAASGSFAVSGTAIGAGTTAAISINGAQVNLVVNALSQTNVIASIVNNGDGTFTMNMVGTPQAVYFLQTTADLTPAAAWTTITGSTNAAPANGAWSFVVSNSPPAYYRSVAVNPSP